MNPMKYILHHTYDIEEQDGNGRSALLASVQMVHRDYFPKVARTLLDAGANPYAVDNWDDGILARIVNAMSSCNDASMGCNPNSRNLLEYTVSDLALKSPTSWVLWCEAIESAGLDMREILEQDDRYKKVRLSPRTLETMHRKVRNSKPPSLIIHDIDAGVNDAVARVCCRCSRPDHSSIARVPFDRCGSYLFRIGEFTRHRWGTYHSDGTFCMYEELESARCTHPCHRRHRAPSTKSWRAFTWRKHVSNRLWKGPVFKSTEGYGSRPCSPRPDPQQNESSERFWKSLSWRKHVAYRLWKDGVFKSPAEAYIWATGSAPEWENIPDDGDPVKPMK
ncbi:hypothetical protein FQN53_006970 [Emmonsiellopsis sp. PD_33]|nr:hypothetical protein FQN53_006970 [Emmonsiellopsis sp. PD_33]KAK2797419.1 hypothetical protein FQN51_008451 [Onygenales sp. PD_10]